MCVHILIYNYTYTYVCTCIYVWYFLGSSLGHTVAASSEMNSEPETIHIWTYIYIYLQHLYVIYIHDFRIRTYLIHALLSWTIHISDTQQ